MYSLDTQPRSFSILIISMLNTMLYQIISFQPMSNLIIHTKQLVKNRKHRKYCQVIVAAEEQQTNLGVFSARI